MKPIFWMIVLAVAVLFGAEWLNHRAKIRALNSGDVATRDQAGDNAAPDGSETASGTQPPQSEGPSQAQSDTLPAGDTISRTPPNGMIFAGRGRYQLYRQGDITWRLDTDTGWACILFATDTQWSKLRVYEHGCASAQTVSQ